MGSQTMASECIGKHFITAILLTGSVKRAEAAVLAGIQSMDLDQTAASACACEVSCDIHAAALVPAELRSVLQLAPDLRRFFVLRMLVGMSRERCAALLNVDVIQVDEGTCTAVTELARIALKKHRYPPITLSSNFELHQPVMCN